MGQKLQIDGLAVSHPLSRAAIGFAVVWVEVKLAEDIVHASSCWDGVVGGAGMGGVNDRPERRGLVRCPVGLCRVGLTAFVELVRRWIVAAVAFSDSYSIIGTTINAISRPSHKFSLFPFPQLQQL